MRVKLSVLKEYISTLTEGVLCESRIDDAREKFPEMEDEVFESVVGQQPAGSNNKYLMWSVKQVDDGTMSEEVILAVRLFHDNQRRLQQKDINQYKDVDELNTKIDELSKTKTKSQEAKQAKSDTQVIYNDDHWLVVRPFTQEASCKYGAGTKWCIAATASRNYWNTYSDTNNKFYFVIDKSQTTNAPSSKFAIAIIAAGLAARGSEIQVYDASDKLVSLQTVSKHIGDETKWNEIWSKIQEHVTANPKTREVEEAERGVEENVKALLKGDKLSSSIIKKIVKDATLTAPIVDAVMKHYENYTGPQGYDDPRQELIQLFSGKITEMPRDVATKVIKWTTSLRPADGRYWSGQYYLDQMMEKANLDVEDFRELANTGDESVLAKVFVNPNSPPDLKAQIAAKVKDFTNKEQQQKVYLALIKSGNITKQQFKDALDQNHSISHYVLNNDEYKHIPGDLIPMIPLRDDREMKQALKLPNITPAYATQIVDKAWKTLSKYDLYDIFKSTPMATDMMEKLWREKGQDVRTALLQNPSVGATNLAKFAKSRNSAYRFAVAHNTATNSEDLLLLSKDNSVSTRAAVGGNSSTPSNVFAELAKDEATAVRASIASNQAAPERILNALTKDSDEFVRKSARKTIKALNSIPVAAPAAEGVDHGMRSLLKEEFEEEETPNLMDPYWRHLPRTIQPAEFVTVFLLQNNGHATREEVEAAFNEWSPASSRSTTKRVGGQWSRHRRRHFGGRQVEVPGKSLWSMLRAEEKYGDKPTRAVKQAGRGWWWSPPGINKGSIMRLTPAGASAAMETLKKNRDPYGATRTDVAMPPVKKSPTPRELTGEPAPPRPHREPGEPRGPKLTYKIYGRHKGASAHTRLKGQAYIAGAGTSFRPGELASLEKTDDGKLKVKKSDGEHEQTWEPSEG